MDSRLFLEVDGQVTVVRGHVALTADQPTLLHQAWGTLTDPPPSVGVDAPGAYLVDVLERLPPQHPADPAAEGRVRRTLWQLGCNPDPPDGRSPPYGVVPPVHPPRPDRDRS